MPDAISLETVQAMQAMQLSMAYSNKVTKLAMDSTEQAAQVMQKMMPPVAPDSQHIIDTYA